MMRMQASTEDGNIEQERKFGKKRKKEQWSGSVRDRMRDKMRDRMRDSLRNRGNLEMSAL